MICLTSNLSYSQLIIDINDYVGTEIAEIEQIGYGNRFKKNGWFTEIKFSNDSLPSREKNYFKGELRSDYHFKYEKNDSIFIVIRIDSLAKSDKNFEIKKTFFDTNGYVTKRETYTIRDSSPTVLEKNFCRDTFDRLISYERIIPSSYRNYSGDLVTSYQLFYNENNQIDSIIQTDSENISIVRYYFEYNRNGLLKSKIVDHNNPDIVLGGVRAWEKGRNDKYGYYYKYDSLGNWTKRFSLTKNRKYLNSIRNIKYK